MADLTLVPLVPTVARLYTQNGYKRASVKSGPGTPLVQIAYAQAAIGMWRQRAELRPAEFENAMRERDALMEAVHDAKRALENVTPSTAYPASIYALQRFHQTLASLA